MNNFKNFIEENKDQLNTFAKEYVENLDMPDILKESITYSLVNDGKKIRPFRNHCTIFFFSALVGACLNNFQQIRNQFKKRNINSPIKT